MDLREIGWDGMGWIDLAQDRDQWRLLWTRWWTVGFHKILGDSWVVAQLAASPEGLSSMKLVHCIKETVYGCLCCWVGKQLRIITLHVWGITIHNFVLRILSMSVNYSLARELLASNIPLIRSSPESSSSLASLC
jgi:hypothetical protein